MKFRPLHDRLVVEPIAAEERTLGGIIIPDSAKEKPQQGKVVSAGPGARGEDGRLTPLDVKAGDVVLYGKWSGTEVRIEGKDLMVMRESDIMGVVEQPGGGAGPAAKARPAAAAKAPAKAAKPAAAKPATGKPATGKTLASKAAAKPAKAVKAAAKKAAPVKTAAKAVARKAAPKKAAPKKAAPAKAATRKAPGKTTAAKGAGRKK